MRTATLTSGGGTVYRMGKDRRESRPITSSSLLLIELCKEPTRAWSTTDIATLAQIEPGNVREGMRSGVQLGLFRILKQGKAGRPSRDTPPLTRDCTIYGAGPELLRRLGSKQ